MDFKEIPVGNEQLPDTLFEIGDTVEVLANKDDIFKDFCGIVIGYKEEGIVQVRDQDDNVWDVGENQCEKVE